MGIEIEHNHDHAWMVHAIGLAELAQQQGEVPVGAVIVKDGLMIAQGYNQPISSHDPTAHAEIVAIRNAGQVLQNYRLVNTTLYVTLEPCCLCLGAIVHARIARVVFGAFDPKSGACGGTFNLLTQPGFNHKPDITGGIAQEICGSLLSNFFKNKRGVPC